MRLARNDKLNTVIATVDLQIVLQIPCSEVSTLQFVLQPKTKHVHFVQLNCLQHEANLVTLFATAGLKLTETEVAVKLEQVCINGWHACQIR